MSDNEVNPLSTLENLTKKLNLELSSRDFAKCLDERDPCRHLRREFNIPKIKDHPKMTDDVNDEDNEVVYFVGHSLGPQPRMAPALCRREMERWANLGEDARRVVDRNQAERNFDDDVMNNAEDNVDVKRYKKQGYDATDPRQKSAKRRNEVAKNGVDVFVDGVENGSFDSTNLSSTDKRVGPDASTAPLSKNSSDHVPSINDVDGAGNDVTQDVIDIADLVGRGVRWEKIEELIDREMERIVGARPGEVAIMNGLSVNLHLGLVAFYKPTTTRFKILFDEDSFPSDYCALRSQAIFHGLDPREALIRVSPRNGESFLRTEDILQTIAVHGSSIALVCLPGVHYLTGQLLEMARVTSAARNAGCVVAWDLAHAVGNVELALHDWGVDFAVWCTYKYLNSCHGSPGGFFLHNRHDPSSLTKLSGWWGLEPETRFRFRFEDPETEALNESPGAKSFRISNPPLFSFLPILASMEIFSKTSMPTLRRKSLLLTGYLELLLRRRLPDHCRILTPDDPQQRGAQMSVELVGAAGDVGERVRARGIMCDFRPPCILRVSAAPLFNSFVDVFRFVEILERCLQEECHYED